MDIEGIHVLLWRKPTIEVLGEKKLKDIFERGIELKHYIGFEISGFVHLGTGIFSGAKIRDFQEAGIKTEVFMADWHAWINNKLGGNMDIIRKVAKGYFSHAIAKSIEAVGGDPTITEFILASDIYNNDYWAEVIKIGKETTLSRVLRSITIMGRRESESIPSAWLVYPLMQAADIVFQNINIAHAGIDQRKAHVIAMEYANKIDYPLLAVHHILITNLRLSWDIYRKLKKEKDKRKIKEDLSELKMSKSIPGSAIFIHDSEEEILSKIKQAFCPMKETEFNPIWELVEYVIFREQENIGLLLIALENSIVTPNELGLPRVEKHELVKVIEDKNKKNEIDWDLVYSRIEREFSDLYDLGFKEIEFKIINGKTKEQKVYTKLWDLRRDWISGRIHPLDLKNAVANWLLKLLEPIRCYFKKDGKRYIEELQRIKISR
ncbi:MAG TPA: tyrosine--tRNA ligase [Candidatus Nanopusillus sp.]|nr:tyrosine--tRNA ligase [Candidatus Nanopusillus sp.]